MELHSKSERWNFQPDLVFDCTVVILKQGDDYFFATSERRETNVNIEVLNPTRIPTENIFPLYQDTLTKFTNIDDGCDVYVKRPSLNAYKGSDLISRTLLQEAQICEQLLASPHENIAHYRGCKIQHGRIIGLCFDKYAETLWERVERGVKVDESCFQQIGMGVQHLHKLRLIHCDLKDENIMFRKKDGNDLVIIDFDSCVQHGASLPAKGGPIPDGIDVADFSIDLCAIDRIRSEAVVNGQTE
ncbi:hypothetical protein EJ07DRAFT_93018 [Lizonia empirigonia]|nr:hypothetical protein EJ07DRAFT_93018 [Lizonia empirigonia]